jgi:hypothetical protein
MGSVGRTADDRELSAMCRKVDAALCDGALGLSSGLSYAPGMYADARELNTLARLTSRHGRRYHTHMRYGGPIWHALAEAISVARTASVAVNVSHLYPSVSDPADTAEHLLAAVDKAREEGLDVTFDLTVFRRGGGACCTGRPTHRKPHRPARRRMSSERGHGVRSRAAWPGAQSLPCPPRQTTGRQRCRTFWALAT